MHFLLTPCRFLVAYLLTVSVLTLAVNAAQAQRFVPAISLGGSTTPPQSYDLVNDDPNGNVGIGIFPGRPNPPVKLTIGGDVLLDPANILIERKLFAQSRQGLLGIYGALNGARAPVCGFTAT